MAVNLLDFDLDGLAAFCEQLGEKRFRATQLYRWIHQRGVADFARMSDLAKSLREKLAGAAVVEGLKVLTEQRSADGTIKWLFDVGDGNAWAIRTRDVKGKIVVFDLKFEVSTVAFLPFVDFLWDPKLTLLEPSIFAANPYLTNLSRVVKRLQEAGAAGFVGVLSDYYDSNRYHNEYYRRSQMTIPGVWVTKSDGQLLRDQLRKAGKGAQANLVLEGSRTEVEARAVVGVLPGRSHETILMTSHHDSVSAGAVEDASGVGALLAQLQIAASKPAAEREKTMLFATMDSHFTGYQVHQAFADKYITRQATPYKLVAGITLEHIARQGVIKNGQLVMRDQVELMGIMNNFSYGVRQQLKRSIVKNDLRRSATLNHHDNAAPNSRPRPIKPAP